jgi:uncharacterized HAD superfamily protein
MKLGIDLDGVIALIDAPILEGFQQRGKCLGKTTRDITYYSWDHSFPEVTQEELTEILLQPGFLQTLPHCDVLVPCLRRLAEQGHELHFVTARKGPSERQEETRAWLLQHALPLQNLTFCEANDKHVYAKDHGLDLFVEDRFDTANQIAQLVPVLLVEAPYNSPCEYGRGLLHPQVLRLSRAGIARFLTARDLSVTGEFWMLDRLLSVGS